MDEGGVKYGKLIPCIVEDMTILRLCSYCTHTFIIRWHLFPYLDAMIMIQYRHSIEPFRCAATEEENNDIA